MSGNRGGKRLEEQANHAKSAERRGHALAEFGKQASDVANAIRLKFGESAAALWVTRSMRMTRVTGPQLDEREMRVDAALRHPSRESPPEIAMEALRSAVKAVQEEVFLGRRTIERKSFADVAEEFLASPPPNLRASTLVRLKRSVKNSLSPAFGKRRIDEITRGEIESFLGVAKERKCKPSSLNRALSALAAVFKRAATRGYILKELIPTTGIERPKEQVRPALFWSPEDREKLLDACTAKLKPAVMLAMDCGLRKGEILGLAWPYVDLEKGTLTVAEAKNSRPRMVPLSERCVAMLKAFKAQRGPIPLVGPDRVLAAAGMPATWNGRLTELWQLALTNAGLPQIPFHSLRSIFATAPIAATVTVPELMDLLGHSTAAMSLRYARAVPSEALERARTKLEAEREQTKRVAL